MALTVFEEEKDRFAFMFSAVPARHLSFLKERELRVRLDDHRPTEVCMNLCNTYLYYLSSIYIYRMHVCVIQYHVCMHAYI